MQFGVWWHLQLFAVGPCPSWCEAVCVQPHVHAGACSCRGVLTHVHVCKRTRTAACTCTHGRAVSQSVPPCWVWGIFRGPLQGPARVSGRARVGGAPRTEAGTVPSRPPTAMLGPNRDFPHVTLARASRAGCLSPVGRPGGTCLRAHCPLPLRVALYAGGLRGVTIPSGVAPRVCQLGSVIARCFTGWAWALAAGLGSVIAVWPVC